jgi:ketosteroid isomerase-like protein
MQAFNADDMETVAQCMSADIVYHAPGKSEYAGEYVGIDAFRQMLDTIKAASGGTINHTPLHILADDRAVMVYSHVTGMRKGKHFDSDVAYLFRFNEEGKIVEGRTIPVDLYAFDEFWA